MKGDPSWSEFMVHVVNRPLCEKQTTHIIHKLRRHPIEPFDILLNEVDVFKYVVHPKKLPAKGILSSQ